jgi:hypothetical protein
MDEVRFIAAHGALGAGVNADALEQALADRPHFIACDAGTTDAGPHSLGSGRPAFPRQAVKRDLALMLDAARRAQVPVIIGSAGTAGGDAHVDATVDIVEEIAIEQRARLRAAVIYSEQDRDYLVEMLRLGRIAALASAPAIDEATIRGSVRIVGMMGVEPLQAALEQGVDIVIAGRCSDAALYAAMPISAGMPEGLAWHAGKVAECGPMACVAPGPGVLAGTVRADHALIRAYGAGLRCTPQSIAAHSLYENASPYLFPECSGVFDLSQCSYDDVGDGVVRISGSTFHRAAQYTVKLEGARLAGYSTVIVGGIRDPYILRRLDLWLAEVQASIRSRVSHLLGDRMSPEDWKLSAHAYGRNGVMGGLDPQRTSTPHEVGLVLEVLAPSQELATAVAEISRQPLLHHPVAEWSGGVTTFAFLHNPAHLERGAVYEFNLHHVVAPSTPQEMFRTRVMELPRG